MKFSQTLLKNKIALLVTAGVVLLMGTIWAWVPLTQGVNNSLDPNIAFRFSVLNIGQGDSLLVESNTGETLLIDGGPDSKVLSELKKALPRNDKTIETIISTHPDADHLAGLLSVVEYYEVDRVLVSGLKTSAALSQTFARKLREKNIPLVAVDRFDDFSITARGLKDETEKMTVNILQPYSPIVFSNEAANNDSIVARLDYEGHSILTTGDIESSVEEELVRRYPRGELDVEVLKLAHHGSKTSSSPTFLRTTSPKIAVASMAKNNSYHHPSPSVVTAIKQLKIPFYTTAENGRVTFLLYLDGRMTIECEKGL